MSTEKKYRVPAVNRLLLAAAPFLFCVILVFCIERSESGKKHERIRAMQDVQGGQSPRVVQNPFPDAGKAVNTQRSSDVDFILLLEASLGENSPVDENRKQCRQAEIEQQPKLAQEKSESQGMEQLVPFDLQGSVSQSSVRAAGEPLVQSGIDSKRHFLDATSGSLHVIDQSGPAALSMAESFVLPSDRQGVGQNVNAEQEKVFQQKSALLRQAGIVYSKVSGVTNPYVLQAQATSAAVGPADANSESTGGDQADDPEEYGIPPPRRIPLFLQETTVLLEVGEYQYESGVRYSTNANVFPVATILDGSAFVANATRKQQSIITPLEFRVGIGEELQAFVNLPLGWSKQRTTAQSAEQNEDNNLGIGDLSFGLTKLLWDWKADRTRLLGSVSFSAPTGASAFAIDSQANAAALGRGYWTAGGGLNVVHTIDPLAFFGGVGYTQTFPIDADGGRTLDAGNTFFYSLGLGYAVNPSVSLNTSFSGGYSGEVALDGARLAGTATEPLSLRVAATFANTDRDDDKKKKPHHKYLTATIREPYVRFGLTGSATDVDFGIRVTY
ncbi:MAG TPA: hypothetical protein DEF45_21355 [Rhodopirellula sp.]|nr:hypothetical protein [Rhodopirellula sp.]